MTVAVPIFQRGILAPETPVLATLLGGPFRAVLDGGLVAARPRLAETVTAYAAAHGLALAGPPLVVEGGERGMAATSVAVGVAPGPTTTLLAIGGGAMLAAIRATLAETAAHLRLVAMPTTLAAQAEPPPPPAMVVCDADFLDSLSPRQRADGLAPALALAVRRDPDLFAWMEERATALAGYRTPAVAGLVRRMVALPNAGVPTVTELLRPGLRRLAGWRAGRALAVGLALEVRVATLAGLLPAEDGARVLGLLARLDLLAGHDGLAGLADATAPGPCRILAGIGACVTLDALPPDLLAAAIASHSACAPPHTDG